MHFPSALSFVLESALVTFQRPTNMQVLLEAAEKVGVNGAKEWLEDPNNGLKEINDDLEKYARVVTGVPHFLINGQFKLHGAQPSEAFLKAFQIAATDDNKVTHQE
eukprot:Gb_11184 [translate_table: standard]